MKAYNLGLGDCLDRLKELQSDFVDSIVTDPPYGISFMGKEWDYKVPSVDVWKECLRVLKPGGHLLSFASPRTYHRIAINIEDAGFEIRDQIMWIYSSGFPKSHNLKDDYKGWGTALKPAHEPIVLARKPLKGTVADNVLEYGTGAINIDGCRVGDDGGTILKTVQDNGNRLYKGGINSGAFGEKVEGLGRWAANLLHDGLDEPWSKYFFCSKANKKDRNEGCEELELKPAGSMDANNPLCGSGPIAGAKPVFARNNHPTVKPTELMRYLCRLVTPKNGFVLDPYMGSGSTGKAALLEGFNFIGIELSEEYYKIAEKRIEKAFKDIS